MERCEDQEGNTNASWRGGRLRGDPGAVTGGFLGSPANTYRPGKFKASPQGGGLFAFWHNFKLCTKGPI